MKVGEKTPFDFETILLMVGEKQQLQLAPIFLHELCTISPLQIDEYSCIRKGNKSILGNHLGLKRVSASVPDIVIVDMQQMLSRIVWSHGGEASDLSENTKRRLSCYCAGTQQDLVFDRYNDLSDKDHEITRRAGDGSTDYNLTANIPLSNWGTILKKKHNKR